MQSHTYYIDDRLPYLRLAINYIVTKKALLVDRVRMRTERTCATTRSTTPTRTSAGIACLGACPCKHKRLCQPVSDWREDSLTTNYGSAKLHLDSVGHRAARLSGGNDSLWCLLSTEHTYRGSSCHSISSRLQGVQGTLHECWGGIWGHHAASTGLYKDVWSILRRSKTGSCIWFTEYVVAMFVWMSLRLVPVLMHDFFFARWTWIL